MDLLRHWTDYLFRWVKEQKTGSWKCTLYGQEDQILSVFSLSAGKEWEYII